MREVVLLLAVPLLAAVFGAAFVVDRAVDLVAVFGAALLVPARAVVLAFGVALLAVLRCVDLLAVDLLAVDFGVVFDCVVRVVVARCVEGRVAALARVRELVDPDVPAFDEVDLLAVDLLAVLLLAVLFDAAALVVVALLAVLLLAVLLLAVLLLGVLLLGEAAAFVVPARVEAAARVVAAGFLAAGTFGSFLLPLTTSLNMVPARKAGTLVFLTFTVSPVRGLRAVRAARARFSNTPKPVMLTFSPLWTVRTMTSVSSSTAWEAVFLSPRRSLRASISSALFTVSPSRDLFPRPGRAD